MKDWRGDLLVFLGNFLSFVAFAALAFRYNEHLLFYGLDGNYMMVLAKQHQAWTDSVLGYSNNYFQGLGNIAFPLNPSLIPGYDISLKWNNGEINPVVSFVIFASEIFVTTFTIGLFLRLGATGAALGAWAFPLAAMPMFGNPNVCLVYPVLAFVPQIATSMGMVIVIVVLFWSMGRFSRVISVLSALGMLLVVWLIGLAFPLGIATMAPCLAIFGLCALCTFKTSREFVAKAVTIGLIAVLAGLTGYVSFMAGLFKYTSAYFFTPELFNDRMTLQMASIAFHEYPHVGGPFLFYAGLLGAIYFSLTGREMTRIFARGLLAAMALVTVSGIANTVFDAWKGPSPIYFEFYLWPWDAALGGGFVIGMPVFLYNWFRKWTKRDSACQVPHRVPLIAGLLIALPPWYLMLSMQADAAPQRRFDPYPPPASPIIEYLRDEIKLVPGRVFSGRVATFTGLGIEKPVNWLDLHTLDYQFVQKFGNAHRLVGLWYYDIPTLAEYNQLESPIFYLFARTFFARPEDRQMRSIMALRKIDANALRMLGTRFVITDLPVADAGVLRLRWPKSGEPSLFLYELDDVNVGQYSPTVELTAVDARSALSALSAPDFDARRTVVTDSSPGRTLVPVKKAELYVEKGRLRLVASSDGTSLVLLPLEFSHCLEVEPHEESDQGTTLFRANLLQTGVRFSGRIDVSIRYFTSPFRNSSCRLQDAHDADRLNIRALVHSK